MKWHHFNETTLKRFHQKLLADQEIKPPEIEEAKLILDREWINGGLGHFEPEKVDNG